MSEISCDRFTCERPARFVEILLYTQIPFVYEKKFSLTFCLFIVGVIIIDEMKLSEGIHFDSKTMSFTGFTFLGDTTPKEQMDQPADHALVIMYQPFRGSWVQAIACFLTKGCATSNVLHHIVIEAVNLIEKSGFCVDGVVSDGATWNRSMWTLFGIGENDPSCNHPFDKKRKLWFISDYSHLIKNLRNFLTKNFETWVFIKFLQSL